MLVLAMSSLYLQSFSLNVNCVGFAVTQHRAESYFCLRFLKFSMLVFLWIFVFHTRLHSGDLHTDVPKVEEELYSLQTCAGVVLQKKNPEDDLSASFILRVFVLNATVETFPTANQKACRCTDPGWLLEGRAVSLSIFEHE